MPFVTGSGRPSTQPVAIAHLASIVAHGPVRAQPMGEATVPRDHANPRDGCFVGRESMRDRYLSARRCSAGHARGTGIRHSFWPTFKLHLPRTALTGLAQATDLNARTLADPGTPGCLVLAASLFGLTPSEFELHRLLQQRRPRPKMLGFSYGLEAGARIETPRWGVTACDI